MKINFDNVLINNQIDEYNEKIKEAHDKLHLGTGEGSDFLGWVNLKNDDSEIARIKEVARRVKETSSVLVVIGIGGSYLGARAVIESLSDSFGAKKVIFAGNNASALYLSELITFLKDKDVFLNVISKSGTTIEPAIAFKVLREFVENKYGEEEARKRIIVTTDKERGTLKELATQKGYETFIVPDNIGGRFSVFTPVGLLPIACSGIDIDKLLSGVNDAIIKYSNIQNNDCYKYAVVRNILYNNGKKIELFVDYEPKLHYLIEWLKQLFGESEGKDGKGVFPAGVDYSTDLHSLGQYVQSGERHLFETVINVENVNKDIRFDIESDSIDKLSYLNGKTMNEVNHKAMEGTIIAHVRGDVPNILISIDELNEYNIGELLYFFEKACGMSAYILGINPFNQPGVEDYKKEMFKLLGK